MKGYGAEGQAWWSSRGPNIPWYGWQDGSEVRILLLPSVLVKQGRMNSEVLRKSIMNQNLLLLRGSVIYHPSGTNSIILVWYIHVQGIVALIAEVGMISCNSWLSWLRFGRFPSLLTFGILRVGFPHINIHAKLAKCLRSQNTMFMNQNDFHFIFLNYII